MRNNGLINDLTSREKSVSHLGHCQVSKLTHFKTGNGATQKGHRRLRKIQSKSVSLKNKIKFGREV